MGIFELDSGETIVTIGRFVCAEPGLLERLVDRRERNELSPHDMEVYEQLRDLCGSDEPTPEPKMMKNYKVNVRMHTNSYNTIDQSGIWDWKAESKEDCRRSLMQYFRDWDYDARIMNIEEA